MGAIRFMLFWGAVKDLFSSKGRKTTKQSMPIKLRVRFKSRAAHNHCPPDGHWRKGWLPAQQTLPKEEKAKILKQAVSSLYIAGIPFEDIREEYFSQFRDEYVKGGGEDSND